MSTTYPRVRDACENCHRRKIRCLLEPGSTSCQSCSANQKSCIYALRAKAGRPRRAHSENHQRRKASWGQADNASRTRIGHTRSSSDSIFMVAGNESHFGAIMAYNSWEPDKMTNAQELGGVDFLAHDNLTAQDKHDPQTALSEIVHQDLTQQDYTLGLLTPSQSSTPPQYDIFSSADESLDFDSVLRLCGDLDRSYRTLRDGHTGTADVEGIMKTIEYACTTARMSSSSSPPKKASTALILAGMYKAFEICEALIQQIVHDNTSQKVLDRLFRLKRLDFALLSSYMWASVTGQSDALKKISELHTWIISILQQQEYQSIW